MKTKTILLTSLALLLIVLTGCTEQRTMIVDSPSMIKGNGTAGFLPIWESERRLTDSSIQQTDIGTFIPTDVYIGGDIVEVLGQNITGDVVPSADNQFYLGNSSYSWKEINAYGIAIGSGSSVSGSRLLHIKSPTSSASLTFDSGNSSTKFDSTMAFANNGFTKWAISKESGSNQNFEILRFNDSGNFQDKPLIISGTSGAISLTSNIYMANNRNIFFKNSSGTDFALLSYSPADNINIKGGSSGSDLYLQGTSDPGTKYVVIKSTGDVGIGTATPAYNFHVKGSTGGMRLERTLSTYGPFIDFHKSAGRKWMIQVDPQGTDLGRMGFLNDTGSEKLTLLQNGNIGIGTTAPDTKIHTWDGDSGIVTPIAGYGITVEDNVGTGVYIQTGDAYSGTLLFGSASDAFGAYLRWNHDADLLQLNTANSGADMAFSTGNDAEAVRILDSGNVGIKTTAPVRTLHINSTLRIEPISTAPTSPSLGDLYVDSDSKELCFYNSTAWVGLSSGGTCS